MAEIGIAVAGRAAELSVVPIGKHICYPFKCQSNIDCLKKQVEKLEDQKGRVQHEVDEAERQGDGIENDVSKWLNSVDEFIQGVKKTIIEDEENAMKRCFIGLCPNLMMRYSLSKKAANKTKDGVVLFGEGKFKNVSYRQPLQKIPSSYSRGYDDFESRKENFNDLMEALRKADVNLIGVYGMGGVGKTTLVKKVAAQALEEQLFDVVVMVEITETTPDIKNIQGQIADKLGLKFHEESLQGRAGRLCERLKKEKKVLIVLDNIWKKLDLVAVGIPSRNEEDKRSSLQVDRKGRNDGQRQSLQADPKGKNDELWRCKILLTSRKLHILRDDMNIRKNVKVQILSQEESKNFFWNIVVDSKKKIDFDDFAVEIVKYCAGLPVAIATIANALKNRSSYDDWKRALDQLSQYCGRQIIGMDANVYSPIKLSYDFLEIAEAKSLFLLCSLFNASCNISIVDLLKYGTGLRLFQDVSTLEQRRNKLHTLINILKDSCLLLEGNTNDDIKMHDIIHDVAISIASTDELMFNVQDVTDLEETLEEKLHKDSTAISLPYKDLSVLPQRLEYSKLRLLFLFMDEFSLQIPSSFFEGIKKLEVLNLTKIHMLSLPPSLGWLTNLQTLCLDQCQLRNIAIIGELKRLEILCFRGSDIEHLPKQIGQLTRLRLLELSNCSTLKVISPNVISRLTRLEELYIGNSFFQWDVEGQSNASLSELKELSRLTTLEIHVLDAQVMPEDLLIFEKLERFRIIIGDAWEWSDDFESSRRLKLKLIDSIVLGNGVKMLLNRTEDLYLDELKGVKNILYELNVEEFPQLKHLHVQNGHEIQCIVHSIQRGLCNVFPKLESLFLHNLINLEKLFHGQLTTKSLGKLRILKIGKCDRLEHLFSFSMAKNLLQLEEIEVTECKKLKEIVFNKKDEQIHQSGRVNGTEFTRLRTLRLQCLPQLTSFGFNKFTPNAGYQEILVEDELGSCLSSFGQNVLLPSLENLKLSSINIECLWLDQLPAMSSCCQTLTSLTLENCSGNLKFLFSYSMVKSLVLLEKLEIWNCKSIKGVIDSKELRGEGKVIKMVFPKLINLRLTGLPNLTQFAPGNTVEFPSLTELSIWDCQKLKIFSSTLMYPDIKQSKEVKEKNCQDDIHPFFDEKVELPTLAALTLFPIASQTIWHNQLQAHSANFHNLTMLTVYCCDNLKYLFPFSVAESLNNLEVLDIWNCKLMEGVITTQGERKSGTLLPKLKRLNLEELRELRRFCNFNGNSIELPSLSELIINYCPKMQTFASNSLPGIEEPEEVNTDTEENLTTLFDEKVSFSCLKKLELHRLPKLLHLWKKNSQPRKVFENLAYLKVLGCSNLKTLVPSSVSLQNLETLEVEYCNGFISLVTFSTAKSLEQLKRMEIINCQMIEEIIIDTGDEIKDGIVFNQLECLKLRCLPSLTSFCKGKFTIEFPYLQRVLVIKCLKMMNFSQGVLSTPKLQSLQMTEKWSIEQGRYVSEENEGCWEGDLNTTVQKHFRDMVEFRDITNFTVSEFPHLKGLWHEKLLASYNNLISLVVDDKYSSLRYIFTPSLALGLAQLQDLEIKNCVVLEVITVIGEETISNTMFPNLNSLELINLPNLTCFSNFAGNSIELPSLRILSIENCPNMETFISNFQGVDMSTSKDNCHTDIQPLFDEKVGLPELEFLELDKMDKLRKIWHHQLSSDSFCKLDYFGVHNCHNVLNVIPLIMLGRLQKLDDLRLTNCSSLCEIFELQASSCGKTQAITATQLEKLVLRDLPKLKHIWDVDSQGLLTCQNLISIQVTGCGSLKSIFPASVGRNLLRLEQLWIDNCCMVEEIFAKEEQVDEVVPRFPQLTLLSLGELPRLRSFYPKVHISEWPMLKDLQVSNCDKVEVSASKFLSFQVTHETPLDQPLLLLDKIPLTNLESLGLDWKWFEKEALHEKLPEYSCKLNFLTIEGFHKGADICVFCILHKLPNLEKLQVSGGFFKGLFLCEGFRCEEKHVEALSKLSHLILLKLNDSLHLWEENSLLSKGFQNLSILEVDCCSNIKSLVPSAVSFQNLTRLEVLECNELLNLVAVPTAKSLVQLTELSISECKMVEEIVIHEGDEVKDRIIFNKLEILELKCLPSLTSFYPGSYTAVFPSLEQVVVSECPNMKIFSRGVLSTPRLHRLQITEEEGKGFWKGNLNTTIEHLFIENGQSSTEN